MNMYWCLRYRMYNAVRVNVLHIPEGYHLSKEAIRVWNFLFPEEAIKQKDQ